MVFIIFFLAVLSVLAYLFVSNLDTVIQGDAAFAGEAQTFSSDFSTRFPQAFDGMVALVFFGLLTVMLGVSWLLATNGILFFIVWIITVIVMALGGFLGNAWIDITATDALSAAVTQFPLTNFILSYYLIFTIVQAFLMITVFFAKQQSEGGL